MKDWLCKVAQFFYMDHTPEDLKVGLARWPRRYRPTYLMLLTERLDELLDDLFAELKQLQKTDGRVEYHGRFEFIRTRVNLPEHYLVSAYLAGLQTDTQMHIRMFQSESVRQCLMLGRLYEKAHPKKAFQSGWSQGKQMYAEKGLLSNKKEADMKHFPPPVQEKSKEQQS